MKRKRIGESRFNTASVVMKAPVVAIREVTRHVPVQSTVHAVGSGRRAL